MTYFLSSRAKGSDGIFRACGRPLLLKLLKEQRYKKASLAVQKADYAVRMYEKVGFKATDENDEEWDCFPACSQIRNTAGWGLQRSYYEGNTKSKRVQEKCGFKYQWTTENMDVPLMAEIRTGHVSLMTKEDWLAQR